MIRAANLRQRKQCYRVTARHNVDRLIIDREIPGQHTSYTRVEMKLKQTGEGIRHRKPAEKLLRKRSCCAVEPTGNTEEGRKADPTSVEALITSQSVISAGAQ